MNTAFPGPNNYLISKGTYTTPIFKGGMHSSETHLAVVHSPELDLAVVGSGHDERHRRMERGPVGATVVTLENVLDHAVGLNCKYVDLIVIVNNDY